MNWIRFACVLGLAGTACVLQGIEPDEIDIAEEGSEGGLSSGGVEDGNSNGGDGDGDEGADPSGDGDPSTGDGDGDPSTGTGDGDGDGDGDPTSTGDGDGDGDPDTCLDFSPTALIVGDNPVALLDGASQLEASCGGAGPEWVASFTAPSEGDWQFSVASGEFEPVVALVRACVPLDELACASDPASVAATLGAGEVVYVIVDSTQGFGAAVLTVAGP